MDLNYLYHRRQVALFMSEKAASDGARRAHRGLADGYAAMIADAKSQRPERRPQLRLPSAGKEARVVRVDATDHLSGAMR